MPDSSRFVGGTKVGGRYTLAWELGSGGMSDVWLASNDATGAEVALKVARGWDETDADAAEMRERFRGEARACAKLAHRNIVRVFDLLEEKPEGTLILVMERLHGCTLTSCLTTSGRIEPAAAVAIISAVLTGLSHAHNAGIIHRDIKPDNVFLAVDPDGLVTPKVLDFGIAKFPRAGQGLTGDGRVLGTPQYMSPEQIRAKKLDARSDLFAIGTVLYEMLSGECPFQGDSTSASLAAVLEHSPAPLTDIPPALWEVLARTLDKNPENRPESAVALLADLKNAIAIGDSELAAALTELVPPELPIPGESFDSLRVVLRPPGKSQPPPELREKLESQETLGDLTGSADALPVVAKRTTAWVYYTSIAPIGLFLGILAVVMFTRPSPAVDHALSVASNAAMPASEIGTSPSASLVLATARAESTDATRAIASAAALPLAPTTPSTTTKLAAAPTSTGAWANSAPRLSASEVKPVLGAAKPTRPAAVAMTPGF